MFNLSSPSLKPQQPCWVILNNDQPLSVVLDGEYVLLGWSAQHLALEWKSKDKNAKMGKITEWTLKSAVDWCKGYGVAWVWPDAKPGPTKVTVKVLVESILFEGESLTPEVLNKEENQFQSDFPTPQTRTYKEVRYLKEYSAVMLEQCAATVREKCKTAPPALVAWIDHLSKAALDGKGRKGIEFLTTRIIIHPDSPASEKVWQNIRDNWIALLEAVPGCADPASGAYLAAFTIMDDVTNMSLMSE